MSDDPFAILDGGTPKPPEDYEEVGGAFTCQVGGCWSTVGEAKYFTASKLLTWKCKNGHISKIEGFEL